MTTLELLQAARAKVAQGWTQEQNALSADGRQVPASSSDAAFWCIQGALWSTGTTWSEHGLAEHLLCNALPRKLRDIGVTEYNDEPGRTQAEVLALFDRAIELAAPPPSSDEPGKVAR